MRNVWLLIAILTLVHPGAVHADSPACLAIPTVNDCPGPEAGVPKVSAASRPPRSTWIVRQVGRCLIVIRGVNAGERRSPEMIACQEQAQALKLHGAALGRFKYACLGVKNEN